ncbi:MAG: hypothetical protein ACTFAL_06310 [Candidatus Electronema sp. V4]|uniref:hypothetical protein n=1 Tax=Candidatus Electronema sp. V4 TaxID=3454756 RepID=UPI0040555AA8
MLLALSVFSVQAAAAETAFLPSPRPAKLSADGLTVHNGGKLRAVLVDPNPVLPLRKIAPPVKLMTAAATATAEFSIIYLPAGGQDAWEEPCYAFPENAKAAFTAAASVWANLIKSDVPITIHACWASLSSSSTLGYAGGGSLHRDFPGAPKSGVWYEGALANALAKTDLATGDPDMHITYNSNFFWYYGTDGATPTNQYDLMTVVLHEIAHGLNLSGSMNFYSGQGSWGYEATPLLPHIYDTFIRDSSGSSLLNHANPSAALGNALRSGSLWFHGPKATAANGGQPVKIYAPTTWSSGSSYAHLDYNTFKGGDNRLMVYSVSAGDVVHDPGPVVKGLMLDLGWPSLPTMFSPSPSNGAKVSSFGAESKTLQVKIANADSCTVHHSADGVNFTDVSGTISNGYCAAAVAYGSGGLNADGINYWHVEAANTAGTARYPADGNLSFTAVSEPPKSQTMPWLKLLL